MHILKRLLLLIMAVLLLYPVAAWADTAGNLLQNGGFEQLDEDGLPAGWYTDAYINRIGVTLYSMTGESRSGEHAAVVENLGMNDARFAQRVRVKPNSNYRLSGWIRADGIEDSGRGANLSIEGLYVFSESVFDTAGEWHYIELYGTTGSAQEYVTVFVRLGGYSGESIGSAAFDDVSLEEMEAIPVGVDYEPWYTVTVQQNNSTPVNASEEDGVAPFWPWLLVLAFAYIAASAWLLRHLQLDNPIAEIQDSANKLQRGHIPLFVLMGLYAAWLVRVVIALNVDGYQVDVNCFTAWGNTMSSVGPAMFYQSNWCDYTPGYVYVMGLNGLLAKLLSGFVSAAFVHKLIPMTCDIVGAYLVYRLACEHGQFRRQAGLLALLVAFNPAAILNSAAWCQIDSVLGIGLMLVAYFAIHRKWALVLPMYVLCILVKPQALMLGFLGLAAIVMELVRYPVTLAPVSKNRTGLIHRLQFPRCWVEMGVGLIASVMLAMGIILPFGVNQTSGSWLIDLYSETLASYPYATVNTANLYYLAGANWNGIANEASTFVCLFFLAFAAGWGVYHYLKRKDKRLTVLEPALTAVLTALLLVIVLLVLSWNSMGELYPDASALTRLQRTLSDSYIISGAFSMIIGCDMLLGCATALMAAAVALIVLLVRRRRFASGLVEPVLMGLFALAFLLMSLLNTSWTVVGIAAMAMAFIIVLPMFIRSGELKHLPLCGAVIFLLLYVFGIKMHERYLFPALFLLGMAYAIRRDRRIFALLIGASCVLFINEGIILDNSLRLGSSMGHLNSDTVGLANLLSVTNVLMALASVWVCHGVCTGASDVRLSASIGEPVMPVRSHEKAPCTPLNFRPDARLTITRLDIILMAVVTAIYSVVTLTTLGSTKAPQNPWTSTTYDEAVYIDLGQHYDEFTMLYYCQVSYSNFTVEFSENGTEDDVWQHYQAYMNQGECFRWRYLSDTSYNTKGQVMSQTTVYPSGRYVRIIGDQVGLIINEVIFRDAQGNRIPAEVMGAKGANTASPLYSAPENLLDEQDTLEGEPSWWNSTYFDEIYHARTGFEHLNGTVPYETSHPPLGKVMMSWFIGIFGMTPFGWRFAGALCGILMLPAMYLLVKQLFKRTDLAFVAMMLMTLDCMHFTQTRIATIDSFPVLFIILSYFHMLRFMQRDIVLEDMRKLLPDLALSGFYMGCGFASKWIGAYAGMGLAVLFFWTCLRHLRLRQMAISLLNKRDELADEQTDMLEQRRTKTVRRLFIICLWCLLLFVVVPVCIYLLSYIPYYAYQDFDGLGDYAMAVYEQSFGKTNSMLSYHSTKSLGMDHPFYSPWYEWPLMMRPMYYASPSNTPEGWSYAIFCFGNPWVWLVGLAGIAYAAFCWFRSHRYRVAGYESTLQPFSDSWDIKPAFILIGLLAQFLPWLLVPRGTYIYHYFASVPFLILGTVLLLESILKKRACLGKRVWIIYLVLCLVWFILLFPYASGLLTPEWWMDFIKDYPYITKNDRYWESDLLLNLNTFLEKIPIFPHVYY